MPTVQNQCVFFVDFLTYCHLYYRSFHLYRLPLSRTLTVFPFRPLALLSYQTNPAKTLTYWVHPHTSKTHRPVLFLHGIGIGLYPYVNFLSAINRNLPPDGQIGILAIEIMPISFRITKQMPERDELCAEILTILKAHDYTDFTLVSHSYGSILSTHLLHSSQISPRIHSVLLIDPVSFLLHLPDVAYNFTCRKPKRANEWQLYYFASMDMGVAHTLARRFFWSENILWKEDLEDKKCAVSLAGRDLIVNTRAVARYLTGEPKMENGAVLGKLANGVVKGKAVNGNVNLKQRESSGKEIEVLWFPTKDHAQVFDHINDYGQLIKVVREFSLIDIALD
jgi:pimeloyl-ACP methyl ester carboxylesterase